MEQDTLNGNHNDFDWKNRLEDVSSLPDAILVDKNATWEKLHNRLDQKTKRLKPSLYWMAAACLLFVMIIPLIRGNKKQDIIVKNNTEKAQLKKEIVPAILSSKENAVVDRSVNEKKKIQLSVQVNDERSSTKNIALKEEPVDPGLNDQTDIIKEPVIFAAADSNGLGTLAAAPVKKKLKVVHINELGEPFTETTNIALQYEHKFFQLKLINGQAYTGTSLPSGSTGFTIFKTTKASTN